MLSAHQVFVGSSKRLGGFVRDILTLSALHDGIEGVQGMSRERKTPVIDGNGRLEAFLLSAKSKACLRVASGVQGIRGSLCGC